MSGTVTVNDAGYVTLQMDGPGKNAMGSAMFGFLQQALAEADGRPVLLTGSGNAFSAGLNLVEVAGITEHAPMEAFLRQLDRTCQLLFDYPAPTVAWVNGHAIAGGCILALCCDFRYATDQERARIGLNEVPLGLAFPPIIMEIVKHRVGPRILREVTLVGDLVSMKAGAARGLVDVASADAEILALARMMKLAECPPASYASAKAEIQRGVTDVDAETERRFYGDVMPMWLSPEVRAQLAKRLAR